MNTYPKNTREFEMVFRDDEACLQYLFGIRWPNGYVCPYCQSTGKYWHRSHGKVKCGKCRREYSILSDTIFQGTHTPLLVWFKAMWHICLQKNGMSALGLQRSLGMGTYQTAWLCLHKLRKAMVRPGRDKLCGKVEVDETYIGGVREGKRGRGADGKCLVMVAVEDKDYLDESTGKTRQCLGRIRMQCIENASGKVLAQAISDNIEVGSELVTDGWKGYSSVESHGYGHTIQKTPPRWGKDDETPFGEECIGDYSSPLLKCHLVISLLKRWILGTLQGSVGKEHMQDYLNEFTFRFNRRNSKSRGMLFWRLTQMAVGHEPTTLREIIPPTNSVPQDLGGVN